MERNLQATALSTILMVILMVIGGCSDAELAVTSEDSLEVSGAQDGASDASQRGLDIPVASFCEKAGDGAACDDGLPCTVEDECRNGICVGGTSKVCDDEGPCRPGVCDALGECVYADADDGSVCGVACFQQATCQAGACTAVAGTEQPCETPDNPCVDELKCDPSSGECTIEIVSLEGSDCDTDEDVCTLESCNGDGQCVDSETVNTCELEASNNPCWTYLCSPKKGCLQSQFVEGTSCNDGNACTSSDSCIVDDIGLKVCKGTPLAIDDSNPCTDDICVDGVVSHVPLNGSTCDLDHPCSPNGVCEGDICKPQKECECYVDADCGPPVNPCLGPMVCDTTGDMPACLQDTTKPIVCPPSDTLCQVNTCQPDSGSCSLSVVIDGAPCDDGSACTSDEACFGGFCGNGNVLECDNGDVCDGIEVCDGKLGCVPGIPLGCDDLDACNGTESCHPLQGCVQGTPLKCDDGDVCNGQEACSPELGCVSGLTLSCDDGIFCNGQEACHPISGCTQGAPPTVDDGVDCTIDSCDEESESVKHTAFDLACGEGNPCSFGVCDPIAGCSLLDMPPGTACPGGTCVDGECTCTPSCPANSCGEDGCGGQCACDDGLICANNLCVQEGEGPWDGTWTMTANPNTQSLGGLGVASFVPTDLEVTTLGGVASAIMVNGAQIIEYTGIATDTTLSLSADYTDAAGVSHAEAWNLQLVGPGKAQGTMKETLAILGFPFELNWTLTGIKAN